MWSNKPSARNWFDQGGQAYARFRPEYPDSLVAFLASHTRDRRLAVDVGCGNGQLTQLLASYFNQVLGLDPSADQIANTNAHERIHYQRAPAEQLPVRDASADLITAAQAAHWFDLPEFYREARRIGSPGALLALISYGVLELEPAFNERFQKFYWEEIGPYWPPQRKLVDTKYATIEFPFDELTAPDLAIRAEWKLAEFLGYLQTWSAIQNAKEAGKEGLLVDFASDIVRAWGDPEHSRLVRWPINMRIGKI